MPVRVRNCGSSAAPWSMNCGNKAVKNIVALGLVTAVRNADLYSLSVVGLLALALAMSTCAGLFFSSCWAPR
ncbi:hypothetical protein D3C81_2290370 [compost metagenome]